MAQGTSNPAAAAWAAKEPKENRRKCGTLYFRKEHEIHKVRGGLVQFHGFFYIYLCFFEGAPPILWAMTGGERARRKTKRSVIHP